MTRKMITITYEPQTIYCRYRHNVSEKHTTMIKFIVKNYDICLRIEEIHYV